MVIRLIAVALQNKHSLFSPPLRCNSLDYGSSIITVDIISMSAQTTYRTKTEGLALHAIYG